MENKICILIPYFGKFNNYFNLWAYSASKNDFIDFYIISDTCNKNKIPKYKNIHFIESTLEEIKRKFSNFFGFQCRLEKPYKLCDFKPFYYILFPEITRKYEYWGFGDVDLIYGDLANLFPKNFNEYDVLFKYGHLMICKNNDLINNLLLSEIDNKVLHEIYTHDKSFYFDEREYSRFSIGKRIGLNVYDNEETIGDIYSYSYPLRLVKKYKTNQELLFKYDEGKLIGYELVGNNLISKEYLYIHLQKRKMTNKVREMEAFYINGSSMFNCKKTDINKIYKKYSSKKIVSYLRILIYLRLKPRLKKN